MDLDKLFSVNVFLLAMLYFSTIFFNQWSSCAHLTLFYPNYGLKLLYFLKRTDKVSFVLQIVLFYNVFGLDSNYGDKNLKYCLVCCLHVPMAYKLHPHYCHAVDLSVVLNVYASRVYKPHEHSA